MFKRYLKFYYLYLLKKNKITFFYKNRFYYKSIYQYFFI